ncbi:MAG: 23S rRNA (pseudouridine(1915)-N(3))-methyltransferase RlmH [Mariprofundaceae bacterium]
MKLRLLVIGRGARELAAFEARYLKRMRVWADIDVLELPEGRSKQMTQRRQEEERHVLKQVTKGFVLFDEHGTALSSMGWADVLQQFPADGRLDFVIGGADGISDALRRHAWQCWSLSPLTLPHQLARALALEQLYRALTIMHGHPYHRP